jgi:hypothetical protein
MRNRFGFAPPLRGKNDLFIFFMLPVEFTSHQMSPFELDVQKNIISKFGKRWIQEIQFILTMPDDPVEKKMEELQEDARIKKQNILINAQKKLYYPSSSSSSQQHQQQQQQDQQGRPLSQEEEEEQERLYQISDDGDIEKLKVIPVSKYDFTQETNKQARIPKKTIKGGPGKEPGPGPGPGPSSGLDWRFSESEPKTKTKPKSGLGLGLGLDSGFGSESGFDSSVKPPMDDDLE